VANPWIFAAPLPVIAHSVEGLPGWQFSATISLAGESHGPAASALDCGVSKVRED